MNEQPFLPPIMPDIKQANLGNGALLLSEVFTGRKKTPTKLSYVTICLSEVLKEALSLVNTTSSPTPEQEQTMSDVTQMCRDFLYWAGDPDEMRLDDSAVYKLFYMTSRCLRVGFRGYKIEVQRTLDIETTQFSLVKLLLPPINRA